MMYRSRLETEKNEKPVDPGRYDKHFFLDSEVGCGCGGWKIIQETGGQQFPAYYREFYELAQIKAGNRVLDVGCGRGEFVLFCALQGAIATGVDYSSGAIEIANGLKELVAKGRGDNSIVQRSIFQQVDAKALPFPDGEFDVIVSRAFVEHLHQWEFLQVLKECKRVLKLNGSLVIATHPNVWYRDYGFPIVYFLKQLLPFLRRVSGVEAIPYNPHAERESGLHVNEQSILSLRKTLKKAGFRSKVWLGPRFAYRQERLAEEFGLPGLLLYLLVRALETWVPFKYIFADEIYAIARKA
jgi:ubiquinone/menaquinone biosynthesis C-methylase UbiE